MNVIVFLADGFEEVEALTVVDYLRRIKDMTVDTVSITESLQVLGVHNIEVKADKTINQLGAISLYDGLVIPGGMPGASNLRDHKQVINIIREMDVRGKLLAAICAGPIVLEKAKVIDDKQVTSYPGFGADLPDSIYKEDDVVCDGNIITARGPAKAEDFAIEIVRYLAGDKAVKGLKASILYK